MNLGGTPIALTVGEPAGIGPEIAARAWAALRDELTFFWIGDPAHLPASSRWSEIDAPDQAARVMPDALPVLRHGFDGPATPGQPRAAHARSVIEVIERAVGLVMQGTAAALCTAPIHKKALIDGAGFAYPGHTEFLAALSGAPRAVMMLASDQLRVVPATIHIPLAEVPGALTKESLEDTIRITEAALRRDFGIKAPRLAVAGLNPHAGEGGAMGGEELAMIGPLIAALQAEGMAIRGPLSADTMFHSAARASYDAAIAMYHDQALIPIKTLDFDRGVNVTLGLPFIRTSPDHGTAFNIAGTGQASAASLIEALRLARRMAEARRNAKQGFPRLRPAPDAAAMSAIDTLPPLRQVIAAHGLSARKSLGQNFLLDLNLTAKIARLAGDLTACDVLEVGPGPGGLTRGLLAQGARRVLAVEKDARCLPALADIAAAYPGRLQVIEGDALALDPLAHLAPPIRIVANLPYNVGTELLVRWLTPPVWPPVWQSLTLMFQKEVAQRIVAQPGAKAYGRLAILAQWRCEARIVMDLPPEAFTPRPKIRSAVVHLTALPQPRFAADAGVLSRLVATAFNQRRKMLRAALKGVSSDIEAKLQAAGIAPTSRAEEVPIEGFCRLARILADESLGSAP